MRLRTANTVPVNAPVAVVIPAYGLVSLTQSVVSDCLREADLVDVIVVDNMGDYEALATESVIRPGKNLGWVQGTNRGFEVARAKGCELLVSLNNDTRLSDGFFAGIREAAAASERLGVLSTVYDDVNKDQWHFGGPADAYVAEDLEYDLKRVDGTCFAMPARVYDTVGSLDARHFGRRGWGAIEDLCLRVQDAGLRVVVTRRSYLTHARGSTAHATQGAYERYAAAELRRGMRRKWGADWRDRFDDDGLSPEVARDRFRDTLRDLEDRLGLSNSRIGRRGPKT